MIFSISDYNSFYEDALVTFHADCHDWDKEEVTSFMFITFNVFF